MELPPNRKIEHMIEESLNDPEMRRAIQMLSQSNESVTIVLTDSSVDHAASMDENEGGD